MSGGSFMESVFNTVLNMSITGSYIAAALIILRFLMKKLPKKYSYYLWAILGIRLLCPFSFSSTLSIFNFLKPEATGSTMTYVPEDIKYAKTPEISVGLPPVNRAINAAISENLAPDKPVIGSVNPMQIVFFFCTSIWAAGLAALLIYTLVSYLRVGRRVRDSRQLRDNIYVCGGIDTPFVFGIFRPRIFLPEELPAADTDYILAHERTHIGRGDHIVKLAAMLTLCLHWFNPLMWVSYKLMTKDMELSCDEKAIKSFDGDGRREYANALLNISARQNKISLGGILAFGESGIKSRIKNVLSYKKPALWIIIVGVIAVAAAAVVLMTNASPMKKDEYGLEVERVDGNYYSEQGDFTVYYKEPAQWTWDRIYDNFTLDGHKLSPDTTVEQLGERYRAEYRYGSVYFDERRELCLHFLRDGEQIAYIYLDDCDGEEDKADKLINSIQFSVNTVDKENYGAARINGVGMGSSEKEVIEALGAPYSRSGSTIEYRNEDTDRAIIFWIDRSGFVDEENDKVVLMSVTFRLPQSSENNEGTAAVSAASDGQAETLHPPEDTAANADVPETVMSEGIIPVSAEAGNVSPLTDVPKEPPRLNIYAIDSYRMGGAGITADLGTFTWSYSEDGNEWTSIESDSIHPLDSEYSDMPLIVTPSDSSYTPQSGTNIVLSFGTVFSNVNVRFWDISNIGSTDAKAQNADWSYQNDSSYVFVSMPQGEYICEVQAWWDVPLRYNGNVRYVFRINCTKKYVRSEIIPDDAPIISAGMGDHHILLDGNKYYPFPDSLKYTVIDGVYYEIVELLIPNVLPDRLSESSLVRFDDIAEILKHDSIGTLRYTESPSTDLDTDILSDDKARVYRFEEGFDIFGSKYYLFMFDEAPLFEVGGVPVYRMSAVPYEQYEEYAGAGRG